ncbi:MAG: DnaA/Hda family protein [Pirellulaceae bacterium]
MVQSKARILKIPLAKSASVRRQLPSLDADGWILDEFIVGSENAALHHIFDPKVIDKLVDSSPLVFYGEAATGKTALAISLAVFWSRQTKTRRLCFSTGKSFASEYASAVEIDDIASFRKRYREANLLVIDDLHELAKKNAAQNELVHTLDHLVQRAVPVLCTSLQLPASIRGFKTALVSRLSGGLSTEVVKPASEARKAVLESLTSGSRLKLKTGELAKVCEQLSTPLSVRDLKTVVSIVQQNFSDGSLDQPIIMGLLRKFFSGSELTTARIAKSVAKVMQVKLSDLRGSTRQANIVRARGLAILLARRLTPSSLQDIGEFFGGRDHSTVLHAFRKTTGLIESDPELSKAMSRVQAELFS